MSLKFKGIGFIPGIPARDLSDSEVYIYGEIPLINSGLYENEKVLPEPEKPETEKPVEEKRRKKAGK